MNVSPTLHRDALFRSRVNCDDDEDNHRSKENDFSLNNNKVNHVLNPCNEARVVHYSGNAAQMNVPPEFHHDNVDYGCVVLFSRE